MLDDTVQWETIVWWAEHTSGRNALKLSDLKNLQVLVELTRGIGLKDVSSVDEWIHALNAIDTDILDGLLSSDVEEINGEFKKCLINLFWKSCTGKLSATSEMPKRVLRDWMQEKTQCGEMNLIAVNQLADLLETDVPGFINDDNELGIYAFVSAMYTKQEQDNTSDTSSTKTEFNEFFGDCAFSKKQDDYDIGKRLKVETIVLVVHNVKVLKNGYLRKCEALLMQIIELLGQFAEFDEGLDGDVEWKDIDVEIDEEIDADLIVVENRIACVDTEADDHMPAKMNEAIQTSLFIENFRVATKQQIEEKYFELQLMKLKLAQLLQLHDFKEFIEPPEKSLDKVSKFIDLLNKSEENLAAQSETFLERQINLLIEEFNNTHSSIASGVVHLKKEVLAVYDDPSRLGCLKEDILVLKKKHIHMVQTLHHLDSIHTSIARDFEKRKYVMIINNQRQTIKFMVGCIDKSIKNTSFLKSEHDRVEQMLQLAETTESNTSNVLKIVYKQMNYHVDKIRLLFEYHDTSNKGYLTKSEFKKAFLKAYPEASKLSGEDELDTIFETNYETVGKVRRGMEFKQFETIVKLGFEEEEDNTYMNGVDGTTKPVCSVKNAAVKNVTEKTLNDWKVSKTCRRNLDEVSTKKDYSAFFNDIETSCDKDEDEDADDAGDIGDAMDLDIEMDRVLDIVKGLEPFSVADL